MTLTRSHGGGPRRMETGDEGILLSERLRNRLHRPADSIAARHKIPEFAETQTVLRMKGVAEVDYLLGLDGGGTRTAACVADPDGNVIGKFYSGALNFNGSRSEIIASTVRSLTEEMQRQGYRAEKCQGIGIGLAGISGQNAKNRIQEIFRNAGFECKIFVFGDHQTALAAAFPEKHGIVLVAGTGSICFGQDHTGKSVRAGGYGHIIGDEGSGYAMGTAALRAIGKANDGRGRETLLQKLVFEKLGAETMSSLVDYVYRAETAKREIAALAVMVRQAADLGDAEAMEIEKEAVRDLAELFAAVREKLPDEQNLAFGGGVLTHNERILRQLKEKIRNAYPDMKMKKESPDAAAGALRLMIERREKWI